MQEAMSYLVNWTWARKVKHTCSGSKVVRQKTTTLLSTGVRSTEFQLPTQSRQGSPSAFFGQ